MVYSPQVLRWQMLSHFWPRYARCTILGYSLFDIFLLFSRQDCTLVSPCFLSVVFYRHSFRYPLAFNFTLIKLYVDFFDRLPPLTHCIFRYGNSLMTSLNSRTLATYTREQSNSYAKELSVMGGRVSVVFGHMFDQPIHSLHLDQNADIADINKASRPAQV